MTFFIAFIVFITAVSLSVLFAHCMTDKWHYMPYVTILNKKKNVLGVWNFTGAIGDTVGCNGNWEM
mgnify:CR=1 FL=1